MKKVYNVGPRFRSIGSLSWWSSLNIIMKISMLHKILSSSACFYHLMEHQKVKFQFLSM